MTAWPSLGMVIEPGNLTGVWNEAWRWNLSQEAIFRGAGASVRGVASLVEWAAACLLGSPAGD